MKYDFTIHSMQPSIHLLFGLNHLKIRNINVEVVNNLVVLSLNGAASASSYGQSFESNNTLTINTVKKHKSMDAAFDSAVSPTSKPGQTITLPADFEGFSSKELKFINNWLYHIVITEKTDSLTA